MAQRLTRGRVVHPRVTWPSAAEEQAERLLAFFQMELCPHFDFEEATLFPGLTARTRQGAVRWRVLIRDLIADHRAMRRMIRELTNEPTTRLDERLPAFGDRLGTHIRREERELFERMQAECSAEELAELGERVATYSATRKATCVL